MGNGTPHPGPVPQGEREVSTRAKFWQRSSFLQRRTAAVTLAGDFWHPLHRDRVQLMPQKIFAFELSSRQLLFLALSFLVCLPAHADEQPAPKFESQPIGWASVEGGTTGGQGGPTVEVNDAETFLKRVRGDEPLVIRVSGTLNLRSSARVGSNKTIVGVGEAVITGDAVYLRNVHNVIIRNLTFRDCQADGVTVDDGSHHVWIDHCDFSHCGDGLLDVKKGSDLVTISWCRFHDHVKTCLFGHSDSASALAKDNGKLRVTVHHNYFDGSATRHPRVRVSPLVHVFNNYYRGCEYGVAATMDAAVWSKATTSTRSRSRRTPNTANRNCRAGWWNGKTCTFPAAARRKPWAKCPSRATPTRWMKRVIFPR